MEVLKSAINRLSDIYQYEIVGGGCGLLFPVDRIKHRANREGKVKALLPSNGHTSTVVLMGFCKNSIPYNL